MNHRNESGNELEKLFQELEDGTIAPNDHARLMDILRTDREARQAYYGDYMILSSGLRELAGLWNSQNDEEIPELDDLRWRHTWRQSFLASAAIVALLAVIGSLVVIHVNTLPPSTVSSGVDSSWRFASGGLNEEGDFLPDTEIHVERGTAEIMTRHETRMLIESPAELVVHSPTSVSLKDGKGWFDVAERDENFTVTTERLRVVDLGTIFGVAAGETSDRIQVESGRVRLESRFQGISPRQLKAGLAAESDSLGRTELVSVDPALFLRELPRKLVSIHWSFDEVVDGGLPAVAHGFEESAIRTRSVREGLVEPPMVEGRFGKALDLSRGNLFGESEFAGISGSGARTVAFWFKGKPIARRFDRSGREYTPSVVSWGDDSRRTNYWSIKAHCRSGIMGTQWGEYGYETGGDTEFREIHDGKWHHLVSVYSGRLGADGRTPEIFQYIDGELVGQAHAVLNDELETRSSAKAPDFLRLAYDSHQAGGPGNVPLMLDELYILRSALSERQVRILYRENRIATN